MSPGIYLALVWAFLPCIDGHGRLIEPPSRASAWRYGFDTPHNYNDHELYCGGFTRQWVKNEGRCGICGDAWDSKLPRAHEYGGTYGQGIIVRKYGVGSVIRIRVELTANHFGYFEFAICPDYKNTTQKCLDKNVLKISKPQEGVEHRNVRYFPKDGNRVYEMKYKLPEKSCEHCVLQWRYIAGNNWGNCPNGTGAVGCGPQEEFRACSDITISGKASDEPMLPDLPEIPDYSSSTAAPVSSTSRPAELPTPGESYSPIAALITSLVSFLVVFLALSLLYFHYYQIGKRVKVWLKLGGGDQSCQLKQNELNQVKCTIQPPLPPPRSKRDQRSSSRCEKNEMHEIDLKSESMA